MTISLADATRRHTAIPRPVSRSLHGCLPAWASPVPQKKRANRARMKPPTTAAAPAPVGAHVVTEEGQVIAAEDVEEPDLAELPLSNAARVRLDRARESVVQIRGFFGAAQTSAFHGSGFAVSDDGFIATNYHVVSEAVLHPQRYRLGYVTSDNRTGRLQVYRRRHPQ